MLFLRYERERHFFFVSEVSLPLHWAIICHFILNMLGQVLKSIVISALRVYINFYPAYHSSFRLNVFCFISPVLSILPLTLKLRGRDDMQLSKQILLILLNFPVSTLAKNYYSRSLINLARVISLTSSTYSHNYSRTRNLAIQ